MKQYDVIIVGAGIAGLECAKNLAETDLSVLLIERNKEISRKVCAEGIVTTDLEYIPKEYINFDFQKADIYYKNKMLSFPDQNGIISSIRREDLLNFELEKLKKHHNINFLFDSTVTEICSDNTLKLDNGETLRYKFLVGADGATSVVRRFLGLPVTKVWMAMQYILPKKFEGFKFYLDDKLFEMGYAWIFPNSNYTSIGCGGDMRLIKPSILKKNLEFWLKNNNINVAGAKFESALISYDYRGYKFENIFLTGDAAGLVSGFFGRGIMAAYLSGRQVAFDILNIKTPNLIEQWLKKKRHQEKYLFFVKNRVTRTLSLSIAMWLLKYKIFRDIFEKKVRKTI